MQKKRVLFVKFRKPTKLIDIIGDYSYTRSNLINMEIAARDIYKNTAGTICKSLCLTFESAIYLADEKEMRVLSAIEG